MKNQLHCTQNNFYLKILYIFICNKKTDRIFLNKLFIVRYSVHFIDYRRFKVFRSSHGVRIHISRVYPIKSIKGWSDIWNLEIYKLIDNFLYVRKFFLNRDWNKCSWLLEKINSSFVLFNSFQSISKEVMRSLKKMASEIS